MSRSARLGCLLLAVPLAALAGFTAFRSILHVPEGSIAVRGDASGAGGARFEGPGLHLRVPFSERTALYPAAPVKVEGRLSLEGPAGATGVQYIFQMAARKGDPDALLSLAPDGDLVAAAKSILEEAASREGPGGSAPGTAEWVARLVGPLGLIGESLVLGEAPVADAKIPTVGETIGASYGGPRHPVLLIGLDGADWEVMEPMMARGELPVLSSLRSRGAWGVLRSMQPTLSPLLWTTVATGRTPDEHGIVDFLVHDAATGREIPITSRHRRTAALWSILTSIGRESLTVGWWATWPAEEVLGLMATDRVAYSLFRSGSEAGIEATVWPPLMEARVRGLVVPPSEVTLQEMRAIIDIDGAGLEALKARLDDPASWEEPAAHLLRILASTRSYHAIALDRIRSSQPSLSLVYYQGIDEVCHRFAAYAPPAMRWVDRSKVDAYDGAVPAFYRLQDRLVGELLDAADPGTNVVVISDHGFAWGDARPTDVPPDIEGKPGRWHTLDGVILAAGPSVTPGRLRDEPGLLDLAPTILALLSLPASEEMAGRAISAIAGGKPPAPPRIASWESGRDRGTGPGTLTSGVDAEMLARLTALGYVDIPHEGAQGGGKGSAPGPGGSVTGHLNTGNALLARREFPRAAEEFRAALALAPGYVPARLGLAQSLIATGEAGKGWEEIAAALRDGADLDAGIYMRVARFHVENREPARGAALFESLPARDGLEAARLVALGVLLEADGRAAEAERAVREGLRLDPTLPEGLQLVYELLTRRGDLEALASLLTSALSARPGHVQASNFLALTRERQGRLDEAVEVLESTLLTSPRSLPTLSNLAGLLIRRGDEERALPLLGRALEIDPAHPESLVNMIVVMGRLGDIDGARRTFEGAGRLAGRVDMLNAFGFALYVNGALEEARGKLQESLARRPDQDDVKELLASIDRARSGALPHASSPPPGL